MKVGIDDARRLLRYAAHAYKAKQLEEAETAALLVIASAPQWAEGWTILGMVRFASSEHDDAIVAFGRALQIQPGNLQLWVDLAESCLAVMRYEQAAAALRQAMQLDPNAAHPAGRRARVIAAKTMTRLKKGSA